jgi:hypothetical protein
MFSPTLLSQGGGDQLIRWAVYSLLDSSTKRERYLYSACARVNIRDLTYDFGLADGAARLANIIYSFKIIFCASISTNKN